MSRDPCFICTLHISINCSGDFLKTHLNNPLFQVNLSTFHLKLHREVSCYSNFWVQFRFWMKLFMKYNNNWFKLILIALSRVCSQIQSSFDAELGYLGCIFINHISKYSKKKRIRNGKIEQDLVAMNLFSKTIYLAI